MQLYLTNVVFQKAIQFVYSSSVWSDPCLQKALFFTGYEFSDSVFDNEGLFSIGSHDSP